MADAIIHQLADAIAAHLAGETYTLQCAFAVHDAPELAPEDLDPSAGARCWIVPDGWTEELEARSAYWAGEFGFWLVVAKRLESDTDAGRAGGDDQTEIRALTYLVEEIRNRLRGTRLAYNDAGATALWRRAGAQGGGSPWPYAAKAALTEKGVFLSAAYLVYAA